MQITKLLQYSPTVMSGRWALPAAVMLKSLLLTPNNFRKATL